MKRNLKLIVTVAIVAFAGMMFLKARVIEAQTQPAQVITAGQSPHFKNIKVLNDMPADQMGRVMNLFSASLGVNCNYCHIEGDFSKDGKEEKESARQMITMTLGINKNSFNGRSEISCNTCHQGHTHPQSAINLNPV